MPFINRDGNSIALCVSDAIVGTGKLPTTLELQLNHGSLLNSNMFCIILGGIGGVGIHISLLMYEVNHILRLAALHLCLFLLYRKEHDISHLPHSGEEGLANNKNVLLIGMLGCLRRLKSLDL